MARFQTISLFMGLSLLLLQPVSIMANMANPRLNLPRLPENRAGLHWSDEEATSEVFAQGAISCFCPTVPCGHGTAAGCIASCFAPTKAHCSCDALCDLYAMPSGRNLCHCK